MAGGEAGEVGCREQTGRIVETDWGLVLAVGMAETDQHGGGGVEWLLRQGLSSHFCEYGRPDTPVVCSASHVGTECEFAAKGDERGEMVIFGWLRRFTILGVKLDECATCGQVCEHVVGRKTNWGHVFWFPVLFLGFSHGMICSTCGAWTPLSWQAVRAAMKSGVLPLDRPRPSAPTLLAAAAAQEGKPPPHPAVVFDRLLVNPKRGAWDLYLKAWPVLVAALLIASAVAPKSQATTGGTGNPVSQPAYGAAHQCWEAADGSINGCRLTNGSVEGSASGTPITCYFDEPLPAGPTTLSCRRN